ncbi:MAG: replicative DNA helicase [Actinomycetia bacterium]|nr:replicative DNA helicase [Actinomycetes bacterium]MCH9800296.1 replicative DNA helicase [Actinomycetes bacterium]
MSVAELPPPPSDAPGPTEDRLPPQDIPAERSVLGAMLLSKDAIADVVEELRVEDFYRPDHQTIFGTILDLFTKGQPADMVTVADALTRSGDLNRVGGAPYLHTLSAEVPTAANATYYAQIVHGKAVLRNLVNAGTRIAQWGYAGEGEVEQIADRAQAEVFEATVTRAANDYRPLGEVMPDAIAEIEGIASRGGEMVGVPTGFVDLDRLTNGLHPGQLIIVAARPAIGKALAVDTPVPTPQGWTTMGEISVGEQVLAPDGTATEVVAATEVMVGRPCYLVEFSDGSRVVADAQHQWQVETTEGSQVVTTEVLHEQQGRGPFLLPTVESLDLSEAVLPIDPYALGAWLAHTTGELPDEVQMLAAAAGGDLTEVAAQARDLGISHRGFIPPQYLRTSQQQRRDLLAGLLDAGAELNDDGSIVLDTESRPLAQGLFELLSTFGTSATVSGRPHHGSTGPQVRLTFTSDQSVFRVTEKDLRHKEWLAHNTVSHERSITNITAIPSVPVRCIEVDHSAHLFLAGRTMVPTHNSTLGLDIARSASIKNDLASVIFSLEMSSQEIVTRLLSAEAQIPLHHIRSGNVQDSDWSKIASRQGVLHGSPLYIDDSPNMTMAEIRAKCRRLRQRNELRLVIVDYMQLMTSGKRVESRQQEVSEFSRALKLLAKELDVPVIAISQLNRGPEARNDKKPMLSDLRESGSLEQDADMVVLIHREDAYDRDSPRIGEADLIVAKHRNGPTDTVTVAFQGHYSRFVDMARE